MAVMSEFSRGALRSGRYASRSMRRPSVAVQSMGLAELRPWDSRKQIIEYALEGSEEEAAAARPLVHATLRGFVDELASSSPAPIKIKSDRNRKPGGGNRLNFRMYSPKARRITPVVTIPIGMARLFLDFFLGGVKL